MKDVDALLAASGFGAHERSLLVAPAWLPRGYRFARAATARPDGFMGGSRELTLLYADSKANADLRHALGVVLAVAPPRARLCGHIDRPSTVVEFTMPSGHTVAADYFDGFYTPARPSEQADLLFRGVGRLKWVTTNEHSLVFQYSGLTIGIRGYRRAGVTEAALPDVATSLGPLELA